MRVWKRPTVANVVNTPFHYFSQFIYLFIFLFIFLYIYLFIYLFILLLIKK